MHSYFSRGLFSYWDELSARAAYRVLCPNRGKMRVRRSNNCNLSISKITSAWEVDLKWFVGANIRRFKSDPDLL